MSTGASIAPRRLAAAFCPAARRFWAAASRRWRQDGRKYTRALATAGDNSVRSAPRILQVAPRALRIGYTGPVAPINTGQVAPVLFARLSVLRHIGPDCCAAPSVAKAIAALAVLLATALRHVLRPGPGRLIFGERLWTLLLHFRRRRRFRRRCWRRCEACRCCGRRCWSWVGMLDTSSRRRLVA